MLTRPGPASKPVCHHSASPATSPATASSSTGSIETVVYYPAGDANCSQSPTRILVWAYGGGAGAAPVANGYQLSYAPPGDPTSRPGVLAEFEQFTAVLYDTGDGHTSLDLSDAQQTGAEAASEPAFPQTPPAPGPFPATFPINLPAPSPGNVGTYFAADEAGPAASQAGIRYGGTFTNPYANLQSIVLGTTDVFAVRSSRPDAAGRVTLSWTGTQPYYSLDPAADSPNQSVPFPLGQSNVTWPPTVLGVLGAQTSLLNFPALPSGTATDGADGPADRVRAYGNGRRQRRFGYGDVRQGGKGDRSRRDRRTPVGTGDETVDDRHRPVRHRGRGGHGRRGSDTDVSDRVRWQRRPNRGVLDRAVPCER